MDGARRIVQEGFSGIGLVRADTQTAGRGRVAGRRWLDLPGSSLLMTLILPEGSASIRALPLRAGLGVARALENAADAGCARLEIALKWPNDLVAPLMGAPRTDAPQAAMPRTDAARAFDLGGYGKICGILCETAGGRGLVGIGINLRRAAVKTSGGSPSSLPPLCLEEALGALPGAFSNLDDAALTVGRAVLEALDDPEWKSAYEARLLGRGEQLRFLAGHPDHPDIVEGICAGVSDDGSLMLKVGGRARAFASGELSSHSGV